MHAFSVPGADCRSLDSRGTCAGTSPTAPREPQNALMWPSQAALHNGRPRHPPGGSADGNLLGGGPEHVTEGDGSCTQKPAPTVTSLPGTSTSLSCFPTCPETGPFRDAPGAPRNAAETGPFRDAVGQKPAPSVHCSPRRFPGGPRFRRLHQGDACDVPPPAPGNEDVVFY